MASIIDDLLRRAVSAGASDIHLKVGSPPVARIDGELRKLDGFDSLTPENTEAYAESILTSRAAKDFNASGNADFAYGTKELGRFRATAFRQRGSVSLVLRRVTAGARSFADLGLPKVIERLASSRTGLVLITGPSGAGKSTTIASIIDWINTNRALAILTIEDPIEVLHPDKRSVVVQREVGVDTPNLASAIRGAMRHDVDVVMVSELADAETARAAIDAAETGHLVISTMRTTDPAETINRFTSLFPDADKPVVRSQLASQLQAIVSQVLIETNQAGRILACEVLTNNERTQEWILASDESPGLVEIIRESSFHGMQTFDQALLKHVVDRTVDLTAALPHVRNTHEMRAKAMAAGISL